MKSIEEEVLGKLGKHNYGMFSSTNRRDKFIIRITSRRTKQRTLKILEDRKEELK